ncbi:MAG: hypothetical protein IT342_22885, partial [Candidatus Melainabacteria bacterium]|nr:hypothetical protein [Candidatus Melainabacteria bacterium]
NQFYSGSFDPVAIAKRGLVDGLSTAAAGGVGYRFSAHYALNHNKQNMKRSEPDPEGNRDRPSPEPKEPRNHPSANSDLVSSEKIVRNSPQTDGVISEPKSNNEPVLINENNNKQLAEQKATLEAQALENPYRQELRRLKQLGLTTPEQDVRLALEIKMERNGKAIAAWKQFEPELKMQNMDELKKHLLKTYKDHHGFSRMSEIDKLKATGASTPEQNAELEAFLLFRDPKIQDLARREILGLSTPEESVLVNAARQSLKQKFNLPADATLKDIVYELTAWRLRAMDERFMVFR